MNKFMAILFAIGAIGGFGLSQRDSFQTQDVSWFGNPVGEVRTVYITRASRNGYITVGTVCMVACLYFISRIRRDDLRK
jgi:hypothetical protein